MIAGVANRLDLAAARVPVPRGLPKCRRGRRPIYNSERVLIVSSSRKPLAEPFGEEVLFCKAAAATKHAGSCGSKDVFVFWHEVCPNAGVSRAKVSLIRRSRALTSDSGRETLPWNRLFPRPKSN